MAYANQGEREREGGRERERNFRHCVLNTGMLRTLHVAFADGKIFSPDCILPSHSLHPRRYSLCSNGGHEESGRNGNKAQRRCAFRVTRRQVSLRTNRPGRNFKRGLQSFRTVFPHFYLSSVKTVYSGYRNVTLVPLGLGLQI